jgi:hypothetical protein
LLLVVLPLFLLRGAPVAGPLLSGVPSAAPPDVVDRPSSVLSLPHPLKFSQAVAPKSARPRAMIAIRDMVFSCFRCRSGNHGSPDHPKPTTETASLHSPVFSNQPTWNI